MLHVLRSELEKANAPLRVPIQTVRLDVGIRYILTVAVTAVANFASQLLRFALLLLADADFEVQLFGFLESFVIVTRHGVAQILVHVGILGKDGHNREFFITGGTERPEPFDIGDCHDNFRLSHVSKKKAPRTCGAIGVTPIISFS
jgi:hypothetical protein